MILLQSLALKVSFNAIIALIYIIIIEKSNFKK
jgi:hypothetical protein